MNTKLASCLDTKEECSLSIVVPAYNEEESICEALDQIFRTVEKYGIEYEVIVVNDEACIDIMTTFINEKPELWNEDIGE